MISLSNLINMNEVSVCVLKSILGFLKLQLGSVQHIGPFDELI